MPVTHSNHKNYIDLVKKVKLSEATKQMEWIKEGINHVIDLGIVSLLTWEEIETRACGEKLIEVDKLRSITEYNSNEDNEIYKWFWDTKKKVEEDE